MSTAGGTGSVPGWETKITELHGMAKKKKIQHTQRILYFLVLLCSFQDLSSLTRDWTQAPAAKALSPDHWATGEVPTRAVLIVCLCVWERDS